MVKLTILFNEVQLRSWKNLPPDERGDRFIGVYESMEKNKTVAAALVQALQEAEKDQAEMSLPEKWVQKLIENEHYAPILIASWDKSSNVAIGTLKNLE